MSSHCFKPNPVFMRRAIDETLENLPAMDGGPFGACLVRGELKVLAVAHNTVLKDLDPTCHGETNAIRLAARKLQTYDLSGCEIYSTTEPCPMCFAAIRLGPASAGSSMAPPSVRWRGWASTNSPSAAGRCRPWGGARWPFIQAFSPMNAPAAPGRVGPDTGASGLLEGAAGPSDSRRITAADRKLVAITDGFPLRRGSKFAKLR